MTMDVRVEFDEDDIIDSVVEAIVSDDDLMTQCAQEVAKTIDEEVLKNLVIQELDEDFIDNVAQRISEDIAVIGQVTRRVDMSALKDKVILGVIENMSQEFDKDFYRLHRTIEREYVNTCFFFMFFNAVITCAIVAAAITWLV